MNIVIIDLKKKTLERYEPYGGVKFYNQKKIDKFFKNKIIPFLKLSNFKLSL